MNHFGHIQTGHPVDVATGSVFTLMEDFVLPGTVRLAWSRFYSTDIETNGWIGRGWIVPWFMTLARLPGGYMLTEERGRRLLFPIPENEDLEVGGQVVSYGANMTLARNEDHFCVDHWHYGTDDVERFCFPITGVALMPLGSLVNLSGHRVRVEHDYRGRPIRLLQEVEERRLDLIYSEGDLLASVVQLLDNGNRKQLCHYEYDDQGHLIKAFDAIGNQTSYQYDNQHRIIQETNPLGSSFYFRYDSKGRCIHTYGEGGYFERQLQYSTVQHSTRVKDSLGNTTRYFFNLAGQVVQQISPMGATTTTEYDEFGRLVSIQNPLGGTIRYEYDTGGNRSVVIHEDGSRSQLVYNDTHRLRAYISPSGAIWKFDFNARSEVIGLTNPLGEHYSATRDNMGLVVETRAPTGVTVERHYGPALRWVEASDKISLLTRTEYDESGNQTRIFNPEGLVQLISYDALGRPVAAEDKTGRIYRFAWNARGELVELSGPDIPWERRKYDGFGQLVEHSNPLGTLHITYDNEGRITRIVNRANETLTWAYNPDGWLISETGFDGSTERFDYDLCGRPVGRLKADGRLISQTIDACGAVVRRESSDGAMVAFTYDVDGRLIKAKNQVAEVLLERNQAGRVIAEVQNGTRVEYTYDADGDRSGRRISGIDDVGLRFARDARKRLISLADNAGDCMELRWDNVNRLTERRFANSVIERFSYDTEGRLREQTVSTGGLGAQVERHYEYDSGDNLLARQESNSGRSTYGYDEIGRLLSVRNNSRIEEYYSYDANGTILETHRGYRVVAPGGRTLEDGPRLYAYGDDGALQRIESAGQTTFLEHDTEGRIANATLPDGRAVRYEYDPLGRRVAKDVSGIRTQFLWDGPVLAAELRNGEPPETHYIFAFEPLVQWHGTQRLLPIKDQSGLVREVLDDRGSLLWDGRFEAYGALSTQSGSPISPFRLRGQYFDAETNLHYNFHRTYVPDLGDYTSPDPIGVNGGTHFYAYIRNPLQWDDPFGLKCGTAKCGEKSMDGFFGQKGYKKIGSIGKDPNANGIDAIYHNPDGEPPYIIAEAKNGGGYLHTDQNGNQQMSDAWINSAPGNSKTPRLDAAFPPDSPHPDAIRAAAEQGNVGTVVYNPDKDPKVTHQGLYGGANSQDPSAPPRTT